VTVKVRIVRPRVVIQDLFNVLLASLYSGNDSDSIPRWRGDSRNTGGGNLFLSRRAAFRLFRLTPYVSRFTGLRLHRIGQA
jgi:hypothetical protein